MGILEAYTKHLAWMRRKGIKVADLPDDLAREMLAFHQAALLEWMKRPRKRRDGGCPPPVRGR